MPRGSRMMRIGASFSWASLFSLRIFAPGGSSRTSGVGGRRGFAGHARDRFRRVERRGQDDADRAAHSRSSTGGASASRRSSTPITASTSTGRARTRTSIAPPARTKCWSRPSARLALDAGIARGAGAVARGPPAACSTPVDLVLIEGFKRDPLAKIEVYPRGQRQAARCTLRDAQHRRAGERLRRSAGASAVCETKCRRDEDFDGPASYTTPLALFQHMQD